MKHADVEKNVQQLLADLPPQDEFIVELLLAYGKPKASITRLKQGTYNQSKIAGEVLWKKEVYFKKVEQASRLPKQDQDLTTESSEAQSRSGHEKAQEGTKTDSLSSMRSFAVNEDSLYAEIEKLKKAKGTKTHNPRFLFVTDFVRILAVDRKTGDTLDIDFQDLETSFDFFLPWAGMEKTKLSNENPADIKAAEKMAKLFDAIKLDNPETLQEAEDRDERLHAMNVFLGRLLFCLFAEDTGIFDENAVTNAIASHTQVDGSDLGDFFKQLFDWLDTSDECRISNKESRTPKDLDHESRESHELERQLIREIGGNSRSGNNQISGFRNLPYVNGGLFRDHFDIPDFSAKSRRMIIESGELNWSEINPDIFGSMFQAVIDPEERHNLEMVA